MSLYRDDGVVLRTYKLREADRIVVILTRDHGKVRAVAKGIRRVGSRLGGRLEPASHMSLQLYAGRELDIVTQVETIETFRAVRGDLERMGRAMAILEVVDQVAQDREPAPRLYDMLVGALRTVERGPSPLVVSAFFLKLLSFEGVGFSTDGCVECGREDHLVAVDLDDGGLRCEDHRAGLALFAEAVDMVRRILGGRLVTAVAMPVGPATFEVDHFASVAMERHLDRRLRSLRLLGAV